MDTPLPKLRTLEAFPVDVAAKKLVCVRDPLRYAPTPLLFPFPAYFILAQLDGTRSLADVQRIFARQYGSAVDDAERDSPPSAEPAIGGMIAALRATLAEDGVPTTIIAGVDFAHVGAKFGDYDGLTPALLATTEAKDRRLLDALATADPERFFREIAADSDRTRICGAAPLLTFLELQRGVPGRLLHYETSREDRTRSAVTFASMAFGPS